jgi:protoporphyrinogen oxidase
MAGFGAGHALETAGVPFVLYDRNPYYGGHTHSLRYDSGFVFDEGGHISFTKHAHVRDVLAKNVEGRFEERKLRIDNYWHGHRIPHPVQVHMKGLPTELIVSVIRDFVAVSGTQPRMSGTYRDWLLDTYGKTFAETFPIVYGAKYHTITMDHLTTDWIGPRMYRPALEEVLRGALSGEASSDSHYVDLFRYPSFGGFETYLDAFAKRFTLRLDHALAGIDPKGRKIRFANGETHEYEKLVSSVPLPELIPLIDGVPSDVREAAKTLAFTTAALFNFGVKREDLSETAITYFYDEDVIFSRVNLPHMFSPHNAPPGCGTIQAEIYFSDKYKPLTTSPQTYMARVEADLRRCGFLRETDTILLRETAINRYANVIYDLDRSAALARVHGFLDDVGIFYCGRYGNWDHAWTDQAFISGEETARRALDGGRVAP